LKAIAETSRITYFKITDIVNAKEAILNEIESDKKIRRPDRLVDILFTQPFTKVKHLTEKNIYAENTARNYLNRLVEMRILEKKEIEGNHYYLNLELHRILSN
jgi:Fic family protein